MGGEVATNVPLRAGGPGSRRVGGRTVGLPRGMPFQEKRINFLIVPSRPGRPRIGLGASWGPFRPISGVPRGASRERKRYADEVVPLFQYCFGAAALEKIGLTADSIDSVETQANLYTLPPTPYYVRSLPMPRNPASPSASLAPGHCFGAGGGVYIPGGGPLPRPSQCSSPISREERGNCIHTPTLDSPFPSRGELFCSPLRVWVGVGGGPPPLGIRRPIVAPLSPRGSGWRHSGGPPILRRPLASTLGRLTSLGGWSARWHILFIPTPFPNSALVLISPFLLSWPGSGTPSEDMLIKEHADLTTLLGSNRCWTKLARRCPPHTSAAVANDDPVLSQEAVDAMKAGHGPPQ